MATNSDFYTMTPGSAVADNLQEILARRKLDARTAMLDSLNQKNLEHGWRNQDEQIALSREQEGRVARNEEADNTRLAAGDVGDDADPTSFAPNIHDYFKGIGAIKTQPGLTPSVSSQTLDVDGNVIDAEPTTNAGPKTPDREIYLGSKEHQAAEGHKRDIGNLMSNPDFAKLTPLQQVLTAAQQGVTLPAGVTGPQGRIRYIDPRHPEQLNGTEINDRDKVIEGNFPPTGPQQTFSYAGTNPADSTPIVLGSHPGAGGAPVIMNNGKPFTGAIAAKPTAAGQGQSKVPPALRTAYTMALSKGTSNAAVAQQTAALNGLLSAYPTTPNAKETVKHALQFMATHPGTTATQVMNGIQDPDMTKQEYDAIYDILTNVAGETYAGQ